MGGYTVSWDWGLQPRFKIAAVFAVLSHVLLAVLGGFFYSYNKEYSTRINSQESFTVELMKEDEPAPKLESRVAEPAVDDAPSDTKKETFAEQPKSSDPTENQASSAIMMDLVREFARNEAKTSTTTNPRNVAAFKQSFVEIVEQSLPSFKATVSPKGMVDVHTKLFGKDVCYLFDASSTPTENFDNHTASVAFPYKCKEDNAFEFELR